MDELDHWDSAETFTAHEIACLIVGVDPNRPGAETFRALPMMKRIQDAYRRADSPLITTTGTLPSVLLQEKIDSLEEDNFLGWLNSEESQVNAQDFTREAVIKCLSESGITSKYPFDLRRAASGAAPAKELLNPSERTSVLKILLGMAMRGYKFDPTQLRGTAIRQITDDLAELDLAVNDDTVRKYLKEAVATVLQGKPGGR